MRLLVTLALLCTACSGDDPTVVFVTVQARPSVGPADVMKVAISNAGGNTDETFSISGRTFPLTFTVTPEGRTGEISIAISTETSDELLVASGSGAALIEPGVRVNATITLDPADFVVNTAVAGSQRLTFTNEENDSQLYAADDGRFAVTFEDDCGMLNRCDIFARLFDEDGRPEVNQTSLNDHAFIANLVSDQFRIAPSIAVGETSMFVVWEGDGGIKGVVLDRDGAHQRTTEIEVSTDSNAFPFTANVAPLPSGEFVAVWSESAEIGSGNQIRARFFDAAGAPANNPFTGNNLDFPISTTQDVFAIAPTVAATGDSRGFVVAWRAGNDVFARFYSSQGVALTGAEINLTNNNSGAQVLAPHLVMSEGQAVISWGVKDDTVPELANGVLRLARFSTPAASRASAIVTIENEVPGFADASAAAPALAALAGGQLAVVWHSSARTDDDGSAIWYRVHRRGGLPLGDPIQVNTTTAGTQEAPSAVPLPGAVAVAWTDGSGALPDQSGKAVRARLLYPVTEANDGSRGAECGGPGDATCGEGLVCMPGNGGSQPYCHDSCDPAGADPKCPGGGACTTIGQDSGCLF
jgi:hypothetical protein